MVDESREKLRAAVKVANLADVLYVAGLYAESRELAQMAFHIVNRELGLVLDFLEELEKEES